MSNEPASPVCSAAQGDDVYMGYAGRDEIVSTLNALLEAERAGAHVARASQSAAGDEPIGQLVAAIHRDETRWCTMLAAELRRLGIAPSQRRGAFYDKAMAIEELAARLVFLNRGQAWVVRKLDALLPRIRDERLHAALSDMRNNHVSNISDLERHVAGPPA